MTWTGRMIFAAGAFGVTALVAEPAAARICLSNETDREIHIEVRGGDPASRSRPIWKGVLGRGESGCCPASHSACIDRPHLSVFYEFSKGAESRPPRGPTVKIPKFGKIPSGPVRPYLDDWRTMCRITPMLPHGTVRIYGTDYRFGCELWNEPTNMVRTYWLTRKPPPLRRHFFICNRTQQPLNAAISAFADARRRWTAAGWYAIDAGQCKHMTLPSEFYGGPVYVFAYAGQRLFGGRNAFFCINRSARFVLEHADRATCPPGLSKAGFEMRRLNPGSNTVTYN